MPQTSTVDHSIVARIWIGTHDARPHGRLVHVPTGAEATATGIDGLTSAFRDMLRSCLADTPDV